MMKEEKIYKKVKKMGDGIPIEKVAVKGGNVAIPISIIIISTVVSLITIGGFGIVIGALVTVCCLPSLAKSNTSETRYVSKCPYCSEIVSSIFPFKSKEKCWACGETIGCYDNMVYKITDDNKEVFMSHDEKQEELLQKQVDQKNETNKLKQIKELKELLDMNAITKEEYEKKKEELLK